MQRLMLAALATLISTAAMAQAGKTPSLDAVVGHYRFQSGLIMKVEKNGEGLSVTSTGSTPQGVLPSPDGKFNYTQIAAYLTFDLDAAGKATTLNFHTDDKSLPAARLDEATAKKAADALAAKIKNQTADPTCATTLKRVVEELRAGKPDYSKMTPVFAQQTRTQLSAIQGAVQQLGALKDVKFTGVGPAGAEIFNVAFENGATEWRMFCLGNGYISSAGFRPASPASPTK
ncbi:MAG TPA: hypothetical protein VK629_20465 [Steroidobacteraceae bacterium]|nr:hypothetical protein [Steroidobacteraceae bacterium]